MLCGMRQALSIVAPLVCGALLLGSASTTSAKPPAAAPSCGQRGRAVFDKDAVLVDASGRKLARFSGGESAVTLLAPPAQGSDLARIETGTGRGSFRIAGFLKAAGLPLYTTQPLPVVSSHVWLAAGTRVTLAGSSSGKVRVDKQLGAPFEQRVSATADCGALGFTPPAVVTKAPTAARVFLFKEARLDLYDSVPPVGEPIFTLRRSPSADNARFFSREQRGGFVHVQYEGELVIDAWAKAADLQPLPRGETSDVPSGSYSLSSAPQLQLSELPRVVKTSRDLPLRIAARDADAPIGVVEAETEVYVMDVIGGWTKVLPKSLHVLPDGDAAFWVKTADLGA
ncbi:MAG: hypothetical protein K0R38_3210 [Polyangiaceae bacterium]|jgi:hypothetical protein|nr:hypothetical protein [Polyangiaceae bacterium]